MNLEENKNQNEKIDEIYKDIKLIKKIFIAIVIVQVVTFLLPLIGLLFMIPKIMNLYGGLYSGL